MPAPLENFLKALHGANASGTGLTQEMYNAYGGDDVLKNLQAYDPNARWEDVDLGGGEGGSMGMGKKLVYDLTKLPTSKAGNPNLDLRAEGHKEADRLLNKGAVIDDDVYGRVTNAKNFADDKSAAWEKIAPIAIAMLAPMAAPALFGALGAGASAAGLSSAVTGAAAGLGSGSIPGAMGAYGASSSLPSWLTKELSKLPQTAQKIDRGGFDPMAFLGTATSALGIDPNITKVGLPLTNLARNYIRSR